MKCDKCGRELEEGEVCACKFKHDFKFKDNILGLKDIFLNPSSSLKKYSEEGNFNFSLIFVLVLSVLSGLFGMLFVKETLAVPVNNFLGYAVSYNIDYFRIFINIFISIWSGFILLSLLIYLFFGKVFKLDINFKNSFNIVTGNFVYFGLALVLSFLFIFVNVWFVYIFAVLAFVLFVLTLALFFRESYDLKDYKCIYGILGTLMSFFVIILLIYKILN